MSVLDSACLACPLHILLGGLGIMLCTYLVLSCFCFRRWLKGRGTELVLRQLSYLDPMPLYVQSVLFASQKHLLFLKVGEGGARVQVDVV